MRLTKFTSWSKLKLEVVHNGHNSGKIWATCNDKGSPKYFPGKENIKIIKKARKMSDISDHDKGSDKRKWVYMQGYHTIYFSILEFCQQNFFF